jgi:hypothetical protein
VGLEQLGRAELPAAINYDIAIDLGPGDFAWGGFLEATDGPALQHKALVISVAIDIPRSLLGVLGGQEGQGLVGPDGFVDGHHFEAFLGIEGAQGKAPHAAKAVNCHTHHGCFLFWELRS